MHAQGEAEQHLRGDKVREAAHSGDNGNCAVARSALRDQAAGLEAGGHNHIVRGRHQQVRHALVEARDADGVPCSTGSNLSCVRAFLNIFCCAHARSDKGLLHGRGRNGGIVQ